MKIVFTITLLITVIINSYSVGYALDQTNQPVSSAPAPSNIMARYEGGITGHDKKLEGTLHFDDANKRLLFRDQLGKDRFFIPYDVIKSTYADAQTRTGTVVKKVGPVPYFGAWYMKKERKYLTIQYQTSDSTVSHMTSFRIPDKNLLAEVVNALGGRAELVPHGDVFIRPEYAEKNRTIQEATISDVSPENKRINNKAIKQVKPKYPKEARKKLAVGIVDVQVKINEAGKVVKAEAISGDPLLHEAAVKAAYGWVFQPTYSNGKPVETSGIISFSFSIKR
jgi:TonB family protein